MVFAVAAMVASATILTPGAPPHALDVPFSILQAEAGDLAFINGAEIDAEGVRHVVLDSPVGPRRDPSPCDGRRVRVADDLDAVVNQAGVGAVFCLDPGLHRIDAPLVMKNDQQLRGVEGTIISGARVVGGWRPGDDPGEWVANWWHPEPWKPASPCDNGVETCNEATDLFVDDLHLPRVASRAAVDGRRSFIDYDRGEVVIGIDPTGRTVEVSRPLKFGIVDRAEPDAGPAADGVVLDNFVIEKIGTRSQHGAIDSKSSWNVTNVEVRSVHGVGIRGPVGPFSRVERTYIHDIGQLGIGGTRLDGGYGDHEPIYYVGNEITRSNYGGYRLSWETGAAKWTQLNGLVVQDNFIHDAAHVGIWIDVNVRNAVIERNVVTNNDTRGVFFEISCNALIRDNVIRNNGSNNDDGRMRNAGILIVASGDPDVQTVVSGNVIDRNGDGIGLLQRRRTDQPGRCSTERTVGGTTEYIHRLENVLVTDNDITLLPGDLSRTGIGRYAGDIYGENYQFTANRYRVADTGAAHFEANGGLVDYATWRSNAGQDAGGSISSYRPSSPCDTPIQNAPAVGLRASVDTGGDHQIWVRMRSPDRYNNSVFLTLDDKCPVVVGDDTLETTPGAWQWVRASTQSGAGVFAMSSGAHDLELVRREEGVAIDKVAVIRNGSGCRPQGTGVTCGDRNDAPIFASFDDVSSPLGGDVAVDLGRAVADPDCDQLTLAAVGLPTGLVMDATGVVTGAPTAVGTHRVRLTADDGRVATQVSFDWRVAAGAPDTTSSIGTGGAPIWAALASQNTDVGLSTTIDLSGLAADPDCDTLSLAASGLPPGVQLDAQGVLSGAPNEHGEFDVMLSASDGTSSTATNFTWSVAPGVDNPPVWTAPADRTSFVNVPVRLDLGAAATDPEGQPVAITATNLPAGLALTTGNVFAGTPVREGVHVVTLTANDGANESTVTFSWTIRAGSLALVLDEFDRTEAKGWGSAPIGGDWAAPTTKPHRDYSVSGGLGRVEVPARATRRADLPVAVRDVIVHAELGVTELPGARQNSRLWVVARSQSQNSQYRARVIVDAGGVAKLALTKITGGGEKVLAAQVPIAGLGTGMVASDRIALDLETEGAGPTTLRAKAWVVGTPEPADWMRVATDGTAALQVAGAAGVRFWGSARFTALVDRIEVRELGAVPPPQNRAPEWLPVDDRTGVEGSALEPFDLGAHVTDPDGDPLTLTVTGLPDGLSMSAVGVVTGSLSAVGSYAVQVTATDGAGASALVGFGWSVEPAPPVGSFVLDEFDRAGAGWGSADVGGAWQTNGNGFSTSDGAGVISLSSGMRRASLPVAAVDVEVRSVVSFDDRPSSRANFAWLTARSSGDAEEYRARLRLVSDGTLRLALVVRYGSGGEALLGNEVVVAEDYAAGGPVEVRFEVSGASPTTLRAKAWVGDVVPGWLATGVDSTPALQDPGEIGVRVVSFAPMMVRVGRIEAVLPG